jgi:luciferase family oxidoreductase group 1
MKLNILDQSPISSGSSAAEAIENTLQLAIEADKLGYCRFWVSEHHNTKSFASASPEILIGKIASATEKIRVGSGGVLLPHYSPLKIAEQFKLLEILYPGRIDLGIGRAGGADNETYKALNSDLKPEDLFKKFDHLIAYLKNDRNKKPFPTVAAVPNISSHPELWVLGTSTSSAEYAAKRGLPYSFASFINDEQCIQSLGTYFQNFTPSEFLDKPYVNLAVYSITADTEEKAENLLRSAEVWLVRSLLRRENIPFPSIEEAERFEFNPQEKMIVEFRRRSVIVGDPKKTADNIKKIIKDFALSEVTIVTITHSFEDRIKSYRLTANELLQ